MRMRWVAFSLLVIIALGAAGCSRDESSTVTGTASEADASEGDVEKARDLASEPSADSMASERAGGGAAGARATGAANDVAQAPDPGLPPLPEVLPGSAKVIKNINLQVRIRKGEFQRQFARASTVAEQFQGFVSGSQVSRTEDGELASGMLTIRVPSDRFEQAVARLKELGEVTAEDRTGQDVSREFVDLEARLRHAQTEEAFYLKLMGEAKTVSDMIQVQSQLSSVQLRIEEIQGQLQYLKDQTSFSTITANIYEPGAALLGEPKPLAKAWAEAVDAFQSVISGAVIGVGWIAPFAIVGLIGLGIYRISRRRGKRVAAEPSV
jgi:Domain of unknown function (DUF4349)